MTRAFVRGQAHRGRLQVAAAPEIGENLEILAQCAIELAGFDVKARLAFSKISA